MHTLRENRPLCRIGLASATTFSGTVPLLSLNPRMAPDVAALAPALPRVAPVGTGRRRPLMPARLPQPLP
ncbi:hypothetical protein OG440_02585 [Streptomyces sp. NBC_00637]|uniref:hypothetical protein n=1 Tax=Streptomyces sp. NBC_00637 TaxID=2903667 RepID=UPI0032479479